MSLRPNDEAPPRFQVSPRWGWILSGVTTAIFALGLLTSILVRVQAHGLAPGILKPGEGVRVLNAQAAGVIGETFARSGDLLKPGAPIVDIQPPELQTSLQATEGQLRLLGETSKQFEDISQRLAGDQLAAVQSRIHFLNAQVESSIRSVALQEQRLETNKSLMRQGLLSKAAVDDSQDLLDQARRQLESTRQALAQSHQDLASFRAAEEKQSLERRQGLEEARIRLESLKLTQSKTVVRSPVEGYLEGMVLKPGESVQAGRPVARIVPVHDPLRVVVFIPEKDRPFLSPGDPVTIQLDAFPFLEFGALQGRIHRIAQDLANPYEVEEAFGSPRLLPGPAFRMEVDLGPGRPKSMGSILLRPGMLLQVRYAVRRQRLISVLIQPLERWLR